MGAYVRLELHERSPSDRPNGADYTRLHELLSTKGIVRSIVVKEHGEQCLPSGFYYTKSEDKQAIGRDLAWAVKTSGYAYSYVIVLSNGALVRNLEACSCD